jgi:hypothetical protein
MIAIIATTISRLDQGESAGASHGTSCPSCSPRFVDVLIGARGALLKRRRLQRRAGGTDCRTGAVRRARLSAARAAPSPSRAAPRGRPAPAWRSPRACASWPLARSRSRASSRSWIATPSSTRGSSAASRAGSAARRRPSSRRVRGRARARPAGDAVAVDEDQGWRSRPRAGWLIAQNGAVTFAPVATTVTQQSWGRQRRAQPAALPRRRVGPRLPDVVAARARGERLARHDLAVESRGRSARA